MQDKGGSATPKAFKDWVNPNLVENLEFKSPNAAPKDVFSTTTLGYAKAIKSTKIDYKKKVEDEKQHRLKMRRLVLDPHFDYGYDPKNNCPSNQEMEAEGIPKWEAPLTFDNHQCEENKQLVEKQNFTISSGIAGGKPAQQDVWINQFNDSFMRATFSQTGSKQSLFDIREETGRMRRSCVPFGMNSPTATISTPTSDMS
jgi:hypothetical protein